MLPLTREQSNWNESGNTLGCCFYLFCDVRFISREIPLCWKKAGTLRCSWGFSAKVTFQAIQGFTGVWKWSTSHKIHSAACWDDRSQETWGSFFILLLITYDLGHVISSPQISMSPCVNRQEGLVRGGSCRLASSNCRIPRRQRCDGLSQVSGWEKDGITQVWELMPFFKLLTHITSFCHFGCDVPSSC